MLAASGTRKSQRSTKSDYRCDSNPEAVRSRFDIAATEGADRGQSRRTLAPLEFS